MPWYGWPTVVVRKFGGLNDSGGDAGSPVAASPTVVVSFTTLPFGSVTVTVVTSGGFLLSLGACGSWPSVPCGSTRANGDYAPRT